MRTIAGWSLAAMLTAAGVVSAGASASNGCPVVVAPAAVNAAAPAPSVAQVNPGYRSFSFEPAAAATAAQVPQGGQVYRSYSYSPSSAPVYRPTYTRGINRGAGQLNPLPKTLR